MFDSDLKEKLRQHTAFTLIGLTLAALGTIASLSGSYLVSRFDKLDADFRQEDYALNEFLAKSSRSNDFLKLALETQRRSLERSKRFPVEELLKKSSISHLRNVGQSGLDEAMEDLAHVTGYSPETTGLPVRLHESVDAVLKAEIEYWRFIGGTLESLESGKSLSRTMLTNLREKDREEYFAAKVFSSTFEDASFGLESRRQLVMRRRDEVSKETKRFLWRSRAAGVGLFIAIFGFVEMLWFVLRARSTEKPIRPSISSFE